MHRHKYFRNAAYKKKLEALYSSGSRRVYFLTDEPCVYAQRRDGRRHDLFHKRRGQVGYIYWERPSVKYSMHEYIYDNRAWKQLLKKSTAKRNRQIKIDLEDAAPQQKSAYHRADDIWNYD